MDNQNNSSEARQGERQNKITENKNFGTHTKFVLQNEGPVDVYAGSSTKRKSSKLRKFVGSSKVCCERSGEDREREEGREREKSKKQGLNKVGLEWRGRGGQVCAGRSDPKTRRDPERHQEA